MKHLVLDQILHKLLVGPNSNAAHSYKYDFKHAGMDKDTKIVPHLLLLP